ncbi:MAG: hypothetical protein QOI24_1312 [Acidobacteriota bacterium]|jgi:hypothetical protein|nr:hypothetical protein [Acidobacteriota bacterium]
MADNEHDSVRRGQLRKLVPLLITGGLALFSAPLFHPNNTCKDWLMKWGQLSASPIWIPIHQAASLGFALGAGAALLLCIVGPRRASGFFGGAAFSAGYLMMSLMALLHATAASTIGTAYNAAKTDAERELMRTIANAFVSYDVAVDGVAAVLLSGGAVLLVWYLWRVSIISLPLAVVLAGDGAIWGVQYYRLTRVFHFTFPEWVPYTSQGLFLCAIGIAIISSRTTAAEA